jgi:hypothetical protein
MDAAGLGETFYPDNIDLGDYYGYYDDDDAYC